MGIYNPLRVHVCNVNPVFCIVDCAVIANSAIIVRLSANDEVQINSWVRVVNTEPAGGGITTPLPPFLRGTCFVPIRKGGFPPHPAPFAGNRLLLRKPRSLLFCLSFINQPSLPLTLNSEP